MASNLRVDQILPSTSTNVAIGTATGSVTLVGSVSGTSITNSGTTTVAAGSTSAPSISPTGDSNTGIFFPSADTIAFAEGGAEALRINASGQLCVNTTSGNATLNILSASNSIGAQFNGRSSDNATEVRFYQNDGSTRTATFSSSASEVRLQADNASAVITAYTNSNERLRITSGGDVQIANGNLVFSTSGKGIDFSATSDATGMQSELLDDYEEGNWTPGISGRTVTGSPAGVYTKIGREVTCYFEVNGLNSGITGTDIQMTGLPFTSGNASFDVDYTGWCQIGDIANVSFASGYGNLYGRVLVGTTNCQFLQQLISGSTHDAFTAGGGFASNFLIRGCIRYFTNT